MATFVRPTLPEIKYRVRDDSSMRGGYRDIVHQNPIVNVDYVYHFKLGGVATMDGTKLPAILLAVKGQDDWVYWIFLGETELEVNFDLLMAAGGEV